MAAMPAGDADPSPRALESYADAVNRVNGIAQQQYSARKAWGRAKAEDLTNRGVAYTQTPSGDVSEVTDWTGSPLTNADKPNKIAYNSAGNPVDYSLDATGKPKMRDPYEGLPVTTDKSGDQYQIAKGLPWRWTGQDQSVVQANQEREQEKINQQTSSALAPVEMEARRNALLLTGRAKMSAKATSTALMGLGVPLTDATGQPIDINDGDIDGLKSHIDQSFNSSYAAPEANARPIFGGGPYTKEAGAQRKQLDERKQQAMQLADSHGAALQAADDARGAYEGIQQQRLQLQSAKLDAVNRKRMAAGMEPVSVPPIPGLPNPAQGEPAMGSSFPIETAPGTAGVTHEPATAPADSSPQLSGLGDTLNRAIIGGAHGFDKAVEGLSRFVGLKGFADYLKTRTERQEAALAGKPVEAGEATPERFTDPNAGVASKVIGTVAGGVIGSAPGIVAGGIPGLVTLGTQAMAGASAEAHDAAKANGASDDEATHAAGIAALKTLPSTLMFAGAGSVAGKIVKNIVPLEASPLARAAASLVVGAGTNLAATSAGKAVVGEHPTPSLDDVVNSVVFAAHGASTEHQRGQDLATAKSILDGSHPEMAIMNGLAEGAGGRVTPEQQAVAAQYANALRAVAAKFIEKSGYKAPEAKTEVPPDTFEKPVTGRVVSEAAPAGASGQTAEEATPPAQSEIQKPQPSQVNPAPQDSRGKQSSSPPTPTVAPGQAPSIPGLPTEPDSAGGTPTPAPPKSPAESPQGQGAQIVPAESASPENAAATKPAQPLSNDTSSPAIPANPDQPAVTPQAAQTTPQVEAPPAGAVPPTGGASQSTSGRDAQLSRQIAEQERKLADATALQEQAKREGNQMAVALYGKDMADAQNALNVARAERENAKPISTPEAAQPASLAQKQPEPVAAETTSEPHTPVEDATPAQPLSAPPIPGLPNPETPPRAAVSRQTDVKPTGGKDTAGTSSQTATAALSGPSMPKSGTKEFAALPLSAKGAIHEHEANQSIIDSGKHPNGSKATAAQIESLKQRQTRVAANYQRAIIEGATDEKPVTYPKNSSPAEVLKLANAALKLHRPELDALGHPHEFTVGQTRAGSGIETDVATQRIMLDPEKLARATSAMTNPQRLEFIKRSVNQEKLHVATLKYAQESKDNMARLMALHDDETLMDRAGKAYGPEWNGISDFAKAAEAARMLLEGPENLTEASYQFLDGFLRWLKAKLKNLSAGTKQLIKGIEAKLGRYEKGRAESSSPKAEVESPAPTGEAKAPVEAEKGQPSKAARQPMETAAVKPSEQIEKLTSAAAEKKAADRLANAPDTSPAKMKVQKEYLLDALDKAIEEATLERSPEWHTEEAKADTAKLQGVQRYDTPLQNEKPRLEYGATNEDRLAFPEKLAAWEAKVSDELKPLFEKYSIPEKSPAVQGYKTLEGETAEARPETPLPLESRERLLEKAIKEKDLDAAPKIRIEVPGDGEFTLVNTKEALTEFRKTAAKLFPTKTSVARGPSIPSTKPTAIPPLGKPKSAGELIRIAGVATSNDSTRAVINNVLSDGKNIIATDGRRLVQITGKAGGSEAKPVHFDPKTLKTIKNPDQFPNWRQVVPDPSEQHEIGKINTGELLKKLIQADELSSDKANSVKLWKEKDGSIGVTMNNPELGEYSSLTDPDSAALIAAYNPKFLIDAMKMARAMGHESLTWKGEEKKEKPFAKGGAPVVYGTDMNPATFEAPGFKYVVMPMRLAAANPSPQGTFAAANPMDVLRRKLVQHLDRMETADNAATSPFYSQLTRTLERLPQESMTVGQAKAAITKGAKPAEIEQQGILNDPLSPLFEKDNNDRVTKADLLSYSMERQAKVRDVVLGDSRGFAIVWDNLPDGAHQIDYHSALATGEKFSTEAEAQRTADAVAGDPDNAGATPRVVPLRNLPHEDVSHPLLNRRDAATHFGQFTLPGADDGSYRESFVTWPKMTEDQERRRLGEPYSATIGEGGYEVRTKEGKPFGVYTGRNAEEAIAKARENGPTDFARRGAQSEPSWRDGHSQYNDIANPIVRLRYNMRTDADGRKTLFLEEMQGPSKSEQEKMPPELRKRIYEIGMKRAIRAAIDEGADTIGWTTGEQQAERYDLSKQVKEIWAKPDTSTGHKFYHLTVDDKDGRTIYDTARTGWLAEDEMESIIGKELTQKIAAQQGEHTYNGLDLKIGGEGLKNLYDVMLPRIANKLAEKVGGKVVTSELGTEAGGAVKSIRDNDDGAWIVTMENGKQFTFDQGEYSNGAAKEAAIEASANDRSIHTLPIPEDWKQSAPSFALYAANPWEAMVKRATPGLDILKNAKEGIQSLLLPGAASPEHLKAAETVGARLGEMHRRQESDIAANEPVWKLFERMGVANEKTPLTRNPGVTFMGAMSTGRKMNPKLTAIGEQMEAQRQKRLKLLADAGAPLQTVRENYFKGMWTQESRDAFNRAMSEAKERGDLPEGFDVNTAPQATKDAIKKRVDELMEKGTAGDGTKDMLPYLTRQPLKGKESFRKQKVFDDIMTGVEFGLRPVSNNPVTIHNVALAEMDRSVMANQLFSDLRGMKASEFTGNPADDGPALREITPYEEVPEGWQKLNDRYGTKYGPPTVTEQEFVDRSIFNGLMKVAQNLGINPERVFRAGRGKLGYASPSGQTVSQFATELSVLAHELGHQLDFKYDLWKRIVMDAVGFGKRGTPTKGASSKARADIGRELRALADLTWEGRNPDEVSTHFKNYARKREEKMAHMLEAYIQAPKKFRDVAPNVFDTFEHFITSTPEVADLAKIQPGISLEKLTNERYVGLPILGYRIVPNAAADILNNFLSSSLYNNRYFGDVYKAWMGMANALNQTQLGVGSAFHAGFTAIESQVSAGANMLKDFYGLLRGNRSLKQFMATLARLPIAMGENITTGDKVLNAWRHPDGTMDPRIEQVARAWELSGGGFTMEKGLQTDQVEKAYSDWFGGNKLRAAARSPIAAVELLAKPIMEWLVPRQKAGVFAHLAWRIIEQNPGKPLEDLKDQFRAAAMRVDARLGQVRYDRLFMNNIAKNVVQGLVRAPGWSGGTIAELGGAFKDAGNFFREWAKTGKMPENLPDRTAYAIALLLGVAAVNAGLTYLFTGKQPEGNDYMAFRTGRQDENGNPERYMLPSYMKDVYAYSQHPGETLMNKSHPLLSLFGELIKNKDYYGVQIRDQDANYLKQAEQAGLHVIKAFTPFWMRGVAKANERGSGLAEKALPFIGVMPAPKEMNQSPAYRLAAQINRDRLPAAPITEQQSEHRIARSTAVSALRRGDSAPLQQAIASGALKPSDARSIQQKAALPPLAAQVKSLPLDQAERVWRIATPKERQELAPIMAAKRARAADTSRVPSRMFAGF